MHPKDWVTLFIAISALCFSGATFYFNNYRVVNDLKARSTAFPFLESGKQGLNDSYVVTQMAFSNQGNRQVVVLNASYSLCNVPFWPQGDRDADDKIVEYVLGGQLGGTEKIFPLVLKPEEVRVVKLKIPQLDLVKLLRLSDIKPYLKKKHNLYVYRSFSFECVDSQGKFYEESGNFNMGMSIHPTGVSYMQDIKGSMPSEEVQRIAIAGQYTYPEDSFEVIDLLRYPVQ